MYFKLDWYNLENCISYIKFYDQYVYDSEEFPGTNTFKFNLRLGAFSEENLIFKKPFECEFISFYATMDLKTLINKEGDFCIERITNFVNKYFKEKYKNAEERLNRKIFGLIPKPISFESYMGDSIFLEFTKDSGFNWSGPWEVKNKQGALFITREQEPSDYTINLKNFSYYNLPKNLKEIISQVEVENMNEKEKEKYFNSLSCQSKHFIIKDRMSLFNKEWLESKLPFKLHMFGTDDCSYSKWFSTKEDLQKEINYLLKMQPLCFEKDILERDYIFTN